MRYVSKIYFTSIFFDNMTLELYVLYIIYLLCKNMSLKPAESMSIQKLWQICQMSIFIYRVSIFIYRVKLLDSIL